MSSKPHRKAPGWVQGIVELEEYFQFQIPAPERELFQVSYDLIEGRDQRILAMGEKSAASIDPKLGQLMNLAGGEYYFGRGKTGEQLGSIFAGLLWEKDHKSLQRLTDAVKELASSPRSRNPREILDAFQDYLRRHKKLPSKKELNIYANRFQHQIFVSIDELARRMEWKPSRLLMDYGDLQDEARIEVSNSFFRIWHNRLSKGLSDIYPEDVGLDLVPEDEWQTITDEGEVKLSLRWKDENKDYRKLLGKVGLKGLPSTAQVGG